MVVDGNLEVRCSKPNGVTAAYATRRICARSSRERLGSWKVALPRYLFKRWGGRGEGGEQVCKAEVGWVGLSWAGLSLVRLVFGEV